MKTSLALFCILGVTYGACPNGCSSRGTCGQFDTCTCHDNFIGGDCSQRQCMSGISWITTGQGDLNYDGDTDDATIHQRDALFRDTSVPYIADQMNPGGNWESWPSTFDPNGEAHFYMECSNRGLCNRESGECECFEGYTGEACRRTTCPNDCSGHGQCLTVNQQRSGTPYYLWDKDMSRSCVCDAGYTGPSCEKRECPFGDDPLTAIDQQNEIQWLQIESKQIMGVDTDGPWKGTFKLTYEDPHGESWTTDGIAVDSTPGVFDGATLAANVEAALEALPNGVLEDVTVSADWCKMVIPGRVDLGDSAGLTDTATSTAITTASAGTQTNGLDQHWIVCPDADVTYPIMHFTGDIWQRADVDGAATTGAWDTNSAVSPGTQTGTTCYGTTVLPKGSCVEMRIEFTSTPGNQVMLSIDSTALTIENINTGVDENTGQGATTIAKSYTNQKNLVQSSTLFGSGPSWTYHAGDADANEETCGADVCDIDAATKTITLNKDSGTTHDGTIYRENERLKLWCGSKLIGTYTVSTTVSTADAVVLVEAPPSCAGDTGNEVKIRPMTSYLEVNFDGTALISAGDYLKSTGFGSYDAGPVTFVNWHIDSGTDFADVGRVLLGSPLIDSLTAGVATYKSNIATATNAIYIQGRATTESAQCSDRGVCDTEAGECLCFAGYTGLACSYQNNLAV